MHTSGGMLPLTSMFICLQHSAIGNFRVQCTMAESQCNQDSQSPSVTSELHNATTHGLESLEANNSPPSSIIDICTRRPSSVFEGDVLVVYGPACVRHWNSPPKAQLVHADLVDKYGQLTISVTMSNNLIARFMPHFSHGLSVRIADFVLKQKTVYERGDVHSCIHLTSRSSVENIPQVCHNRRLTPNTTINELRTCNQQYSVGSVAVVITSCQQNNNQYEFDIKDGQTTNDTALLHLGDAYKDFFHEVQHQLTSGFAPMYLLKNIVRNGGTGSRNLRSGMSTFFEPLKDQCAMIRLQILVQSTVQINGVLKARSTYIPPFEPFCIDCHQLILAKILPYKGLCYCTKCGKETKFFYDHNLQCILEADGKEIFCTLRKPLLENLLPQLIGITYEQYKNDISITIDLLRTFQKKGAITMAVGNIITDIVEDQLFRGLC